MVNKIAILRAVELLGITMHEDVSKVVLAFTLFRRSLLILYVRIYVFPSWQISLLVFMVALDPYLLCENIFRVLFSA